MALSLAGLAHAQDVALAQTADPMVATARTIPASEPAELAGMLDAQNQIRVRLGLDPLVWSAALTEAAKDGARAASKGACTMSSTANAVRDQDVSLYWAAAIRRLGGAGAAQDIPAPYVVARWREGRAAFEAGDQSCRSGSSDCRAYARMVAPANREIGCARVLCPSQAQVWVCQYRK